MADAFFDIVIVGTDTAGLAYGALCAKQGYTVLVVGQGARPATYSVGSAIMHRTIPLFQGFNSSLAVRSFFRDIGLIAEMRNRPRRLDPFLQVVTPGVRFNLSHNETANRTELTRAFPGQEEALLGFLMSTSGDAAMMDQFLEGLPLLPAGGFWARRKLKRYLARHEVFSESQEQLLYPSELRFTSPITALLLLLSRVHPKPLSPFIVRRLLQHLMGGFCEFPQGIDGLRRLFTDRIIANGGSYWPGRAVEQIQVKGRKVALSVGVSRPRRTIGLRLLVGNCPPKPLLALIPQEQQNVRFHGGLKSLHPAYYNYVVNFAVSPDLLPESMATNLVLSMFPRLESTGANLLWVYSHRPEEHQEDMPATLVVCARIEAGALPLEKSDFDKLNERILDALEWVLPFIREKLVRTHTPYLALDREVDQERLDPHEVQEIYDTTLEECLDLSALPGRTCYKNMLLLGDSYLGALNLEGAMMGARQAFAWTCEKIVLKQILRK